MSMAASNIRRRNCGAGPGTAATSRSATNGTMKTPIPAQQASRQYTLNYTPWGLDDRTPLTSSIPGVVSIGKPQSEHLRHGLHQLLFDPAGPERRRPDLGDHSAANAGLQRQRSQSLSHTPTRRRHGSATPRPSTFDQRLIDGVSVLRQSVLQQPPGRRTDTARTSAQLSCAPTRSRPPIRIIRSARRPACRSALFAPEINPRTVELTR